MLVKEEKYGPYSLHTIKTDRFKTCHIEIIFRNNKLYMLVPSFNKRRIKRRISKGITNINNYNGYLKYADASYFSYKYGCKK